MDGITVSTYVLVLVRVSQCGSIRLVQGILDRTVDILLTITDRHSQETSFSTIVHYKPPRLRPIDCQSSSPNFYGFSSFIDKTLRMNLAGAMLIIRNPSSIKKKKPSCLLPYSDNPPILPWGNRDVKEMKMPSSLPSRYTEVKPERESEGSRQRGR